MMTDCESANARLLVWAAKERFFRNPFALSFFLSSEMRIMQRGNFAREGAKVAIDEAPSQLRTSRVAEWMGRVMGKYENVNLYHFTRPPIDEVV